MDTKNYREEFLLLMKRMEPAIEMRKITKSKIAEHLGTNRQTLYAWTIGGAEHGSRIEKETYDKLMELAREYL